MEIVILNLPDCLLSSVYGFSDILGFAVKTFDWNAGLEITGGESLTARKQPPDLIFIPAFTNIHPAELIARNGSVVNILAELSGKGSVLCSVCAGAFLLAETGIASGYEVTTHWKYFDAFQRMYPDTRLNRRKILIDNESFITGGGVTSFQDLALYLIKKHISEEAARITAKVFLINPEERNQLEYVIRNLNTGDRDECVEKAMTFICGRFGDRIGLKEIAEAASVSERTLARKFKKNTGMTPGVYLKVTRIEQGRKLLETTDLTIEDIASRCGYGDLSAFYSAFREETGTAPGEYRRHYR